MHTARVWFRQHLGSALIATVVLATLLLASSAGRGSQSSRIAAIPVPVGPAMVAMLSVRIDSTGPNLPNAPETVRFTVTNNTDKNFTALTDGTAGGLPLTGPDANATIPAHSRSSLSLSTVASVPSGLQTARVHVVVLSLRPAPGASGPSRPITQIAFQASATASFTVQVACLPRSRTAPGLVALVVSMELADGDPHIPGQPTWWQPLFRHTNHLDLSVLARPATLWQQKLVQSMWLDLKYGNGATSMTMLANGIHVHQEYDVHLNPPGLPMVWGMTTEMDAVPSLVGGSWSAAVHNYHLILVVPASDAAGLNALSFGAWSIGGQQDLQNYLQGIAASNIGFQEAGDLAGELALPGDFPPVDDQGRQRATFQLSNPNMIVWYCIPGTANGGAGAPGGGGGQTGGPPGGPAGTPTPH